MDLLPSEVIIEIFKISNFKSLLLVSKKLNQLVDTLWDYYLQRDFKDIMYLDDLDKIKYIEHFKLTNLLNKFKFGVNNIQDLYYLQELDLSDNNIKEIPKDLYLLTNLKCL